MNKIITNQEKKAPIKSRVRLNLGCGKEHKKGYINIDAQEPCDLKHDLRTPLPFADDSIDEIFSEGNTICLFSRREWVGLKNEMVRVLKEGGKLEIIFLDLKYILKAFLDDKDGKRWDWWWQTIFSAQENEYDFSRNGFTCDKLVSDLQEAGMTNFSTKPTQEEKKGYIHLICYKSKIDKTMKILIGTPIHEIKDYAMERWLENVAKLLKVYPADFLMVDNSPNLEYVEKVKGYCKKYGIENYKLEHLEINPGHNADERIERSREIIRQEILNSDYDAWFSWECDQIIPTNTLSKLATIMKAGNYMMIHPNTWAREIPGEPNAAFGCCLIRREALEKYGFLLEYRGESICWHGGDVRFKKQVLEGGGNYIEIYGIIDPIYHLNE